MKFNITEVLSSLRSSTSVFDEGTGEFNLIDIENAKKSLKLAERAADNGANNVPDLKRQKKDSMATDIDAYLAQLVSLAQDKFNNRIKAIDDLSENKPQGSIQSITEIFEYAKNKLKADARDKYNALFSLRRNWILGEEEFAHFRGQNKLIGPARFPTQEDKTKIFGWIFSITIIEILVNAYALGSTHPNGPIGVIAEIFMFGIANVGTAYLLGRFVWPYFNHVSSLKKVFALIVALPMIGFIVSINFLLAHYRDAVAKLADNNMAALEMMSTMQKLGAHARDSLMSSPFALDDFKSFLLLFVGLLASVFATKKSNELDDPYPGYGKLSREQDILASSFNSNQAEAFEDMNVLVDEFSEQINTQLAFVEGHESSIVAREEDKKLLLRKYSSWLSSVQSIGESLYAFYQEENIKARKTKKEPTCFTKNNYTLPKDSKESLPRKRKFNSNYKSIEKKCKSFLEELNRRMRSYQDEFNDIEKMSPADIMNRKFDTPTIFMDDGKD